MGEARKVGGNAISRNQKLTRERRGRQKEKVPQVENRSLQGQRKEEVHNCKLVRQGTRSLQGRGEVGRKRKYCKSAQIGNQKLQGRGEVGRKRKYHKLAQIGSQNLEWLYSQANSCNSSSSFLEAALLRISLTVNAIPACLYAPCVGGHFHIIRKWRTSSILVFCPSSRERINAINSEKCIEYDKQRQSDQ